MNKTITCNCPQSLPYHLKDCPVKCNHCGFSIDIQPPKEASCNHAYYPENCKVCSKVTNPMNTKEKELSRDTINLINDTFSHLMTGGKTYCVHDTMDNCFETIEEIREAVRSIVKEAIRNAVAERDENILNVWGYLIQLQKSTENENTEASVDEWNLIESIKEKIDDLFDVQALKGQKERHGNT